MDRRSFLRRLVAAPVAAVIVLRPSAKLIFNKDAFALACPPINISPAMQTALIASMKDLFNPKCGMAELRRQYLSGRLPEF